MKDSHLEYGTGNLVKGDQDYSEKMMRVKQAIEDK